MCAEDTCLSPGQATHSHGSFLPCRCHTVIFFCWWQCESCLGGDSPGGEANQGGVTSCYHQFSVNECCNFTQHLVYVPGNHLLGQDGVCKARNQMSEEVWSDWQEGRLGGPLPAELAAGAGAIRGFLEFASCWVAGRLIEERWSAHIVPEASLHHRASEECGDKEYPGEANSWLGTRDPQNCCLAASEACTLSALCSSRVWEGLDGGIQTS